MEFDLHTSHVTVEGEFREYIEKHLDLATKNHDEQIARMTIHLIDTNKTKGGAKDVSCKIVAHLLNPNTELVAEGRDHDPLIAFNQAAHKYTALLKKRIEKRQNHRPDHSYHHHNNPEL
jgi:ribosomal subunit interface protein